MIKQPITTFGTTPENNSSAGVLAEKQHTIRIPTEISMKITPHKIKVCIKATKQYKTFQGKKCPHPVPLAKNTLLLISYLLARLGLNSLGGGLNIVACLSFRAWFKYMTRSCISSLIFFTHCCFVSSEEAWRIVLFWKTHRVLLDYFIKWLHSAVLLTGYIQLFY